jgi:DNA-binding SARP family transcriptional activator
MGLFLSLLGKPQLLSGGSPVALSRKVATMAAYLAIKQGPVERLKLADLLWEGDEESVRRNLRQELFRLKKTSLEQVFVQHTQEVALAELPTDTGQFLACMARGEWKEAAMLWRGGFLAGFDPKGSEALEDWLGPERERWDRLYREAMLGWARSLEAAGQYSEAIDLYQKLLLVDPLQEAQQQACMRLLALKGDRSAALKHYEHYRTYLQENLVLEPGAAIRSLYAQLRSGELPHTVSENLAQVFTDPPLVGRTQDWTWLETHWGKGMLLLQAEPGVGKSRLALEFAKQKGDVLRINQRESGQTTGFGGVLESLRQALETGKLRELSPIWREVLAPLLPELLPGGSIDTDKAKVFEALARALQAVVRPGGVIIWEDIHWLDWASAGFLPYLVRRLGAMGLFLVATARPEELAANPLAQTVLRELRSEDKLHRHGVGPLESADVAQLLQTLSSQPGWEGLAMRVHKAAGGNIFFMLEIMRHLVEQGLLRTEGNGWRTPFDEFTTDYHELPIPPSVRDALLARLEHLGAGALQIVQAVALADFISFEVATGLLDVLEASITDLEALLSSGFLRQDGTGYVLRHELASSAALASMQPSRKSWMHQHIAEVLKNSLGEPAQIARHLEAAGKRAEASRAYLVAARSQRRGPLARQALVHYQKALELCSPMTTPEERFRMLMEAAETRVLLGQLQIPERRELQQLASELGSHEQFRLYLLQAEASLASGRVGEGISAVKSAMSLAKTPWQKGHAMFRLAWQEYRGGDPDAQLEPLLSSIKAFGELGDQSMEALALRNLSGYWFRLGDLPQYAQTHARAKQIATEIDDGLLLRRLRADQAQVDWIQGNYLPSLSEAQSLYLEARERGDLWAVWDALQLRLMGAAIFGLDADLESTVQAAITEAAEVGAWRDLALLRLDLGMALTTKGDLDQAQIELKAALQDLKEMGEKARLGNALFFLGFTLFHQGQLEASASLLVESEALCAERKEYRSQARALAALALVHLRQSPAKALKYATQAQTLAVPWAKGIYDLPFIQYAYGLLNPSSEAQHISQTLHSISNLMPPTQKKQFLDNPLVIEMLVKTHR